MSVVKLFQKKFVHKFVCSMVKLSMLAILDRILHLASQTMYFGASCFVRYLFIYLLKLLLPG